MRILDVRTILAVAGLSVAARSQCLDWQTFPSSEAIRVSFAEALLVHDDGSGPALYVGGRNYVPGTTTLDVGVRRWDGAVWTHFPGGPAGIVHALVTFDDGGGTALYAAGWFGLAGASLTHQVARWDGAAWQSVGSFNNEVHTLAVYDDGSGPELYAGGYFSGLVGGAAARRIARWDGSTWSPLAGGVGLPGGTSIVYELAVHDDGAGAQLYVGGTFDDVDNGAVLSRGVARWNGSAWSGLPGVALDGPVRALASFDDGTGADLYLGGGFTIGGQYGVARWDGSSAVNVDPGIVVSANALAVLDDGQGPQLYIADFSGFRALRSAGGAMTDLGLPPTAACGPPEQEMVMALAAFDEGSGPRIFAAGTPGIGAVDANVTRWDGGTGWERLGPPLEGLDGAVRSFCTHDDGSGPALYLGGTFCRADDVSARGVARWNGETFEPAGFPGYWESQTGTVALADHDDGSGAALYAATTTGAIRKRSGGVWTEIEPAGGGFPLTFATFDHGAGPRLYAGGTFTFLDGVPTPNIGAWYGNAWHAVGSGLNGSVQVLAVHDDGAGPALYAGGSFPGKLARWDGTSWSVVGAGVTGDVWALASYDDGGGPALYVGGDFLTANPGSVAVQRVARWRGGAWSAVGAGFDALVTELEVFDDGSGPKLHAGGNFTNSGSDAVSRVARFDGTAWRAIGGGVAGNVNALRSFDDGTGLGPKLFVGGDFPGTPLISSPFLAAWRGCAGEIARFCFGDGSVAICPCANHGLPSRGCDNSRNTGGARLNATGSVSPDTIELYVAGEPSSAATLFFQGDVVLTAPQLFGDGLRCAGGSTKRLYTTQASSGSVAVPPPGGMSISARSAAMGDPLVPGSVRAYQTWYRDSDPAFCTAPAGNAWNLSNAVRIVW